MYLQPREHSMDTWQSTTPYAQRSAWQNIANHFLANNRFRDLYRDWFSEEPSPSDVFATLFSPVDRTHTFAIDFRSGNLRGVLLEIRHNETSFNFGALHRAMISGDDITRSYRRNYGLPTFNPFNALCNEEVIQQIYLASTEGTVGYVSNVLDMIPVTSHTSTYLDIYHSPLGQHDFFNARPYQGNLHYSHYNTQYPDPHHLNILPLSGLVTIRITPVDPALMAQWRQQREQQTTTSLSDRLWSFLAGHFGFGQNNNGQEPSIPDHRTPLPIPPGYYESTYQHDPYPNIPTERPSGSSYSSFGSFSRCCADSSCCNCYDNQSE
ncbi:hypothetical protein NX722_08685 [Endozoicomonas gorgoniicola]|uniref:Uncharacterized protein n=1 Tax=Endozoicomonas gorgoniicola TaxID=1234144 RepID=A0ABT3MTL9_9GAMM|nr:hypothetical protein [Endozoicomonas gorgoniicola]MCW7552715.1 hypothetical protein [Endozoicomonas gorgoniicola]